MQVFHTTYAAEAILRDGFRDGHGSYGLALTGVWVADTPLDINEGAHGDEVLEVTVPADVLTDYEVAEDGKGYREWCVPAALLNERGALRLLTEAEVDALYEAESLRNR